jgi:hypothetical protein
MKHAGRYLRRKLVRLAQMSPREVAHRVREHGRYFEERFSNQSGRDLVAEVAGRIPPEQALNLLRGLGESGSVLPSESRQALPDGFRQFFPSRWHEICAAADQICSGIVCLFGQTVTFARDQIDSHRDWTDDRRFPVCFYRDIPGVLSQQQLDFKRVWETNRQQYLVTLGQAYLLSGCPSYAEKALELIDSWVQQNPPYLGVNWMEALEVSFRLCSWIWTLALVADAPALTAERAQRILGSIQLQFRFVRRHLSTYSSPNTHLLGEAMGLFMIGALLDELENADDAKVQAIEILESELDQQFRRDGSHREQSAYYHAYATEIYLLTTVIGQRKGISFSTHWRGRLRQICECLVHFTQPDGTLVRFGDDDGGRTLRLAEPDYYAPRSLLALAAVLFDCADFKPSTGIPEEVLWLLGNKGIKAYVEMPERHQNAPQVCRGGLVVLSNLLVSHRFWVACVQEPMGMMTAGHSHAAPLSYELNIDGTSVLIDPGTYTYEPWSPWRDYFRGQTSHNVLELGVAEKFEGEGPFHWKSKHVVRTLPPRVVGGNGIELNAVGRDVSGRSYQHTRRFTLTSSDTLQVEDRVEGTGITLVRLWLQFAPQCRIKDAGNGRFVLRAGSLVLQLIAGGPKPLTARSWTGCLDPVSGWYSPRYGAKVPSTTLCLESRVELPAALHVEFLISSPAPPAIEEEPACAEGIPK